MGAAPHQDDPRARAARVAADLARRRQFPSPSQLLSADQLAAVERQLSEFTPPASRDGASADPVSLAPATRPIRLAPSAAGLKRLNARKRLAAEFPAELLDAYPDVTFTTSEQALGVVLGRACRMKYGCTKAVATLANEAFVSERATQYALRKFDKVGVISLLRRPRKGLRHDTNHIMIRSPIWRAHLQERAAIERLKRRGDRVQKAAHETSSRLNSTSEEGAVGKKRDGGAGARAVAPPSLFATSSAASWLERFKVAAGPIIDVSSVRLLDPTPLHKLVVGGCTERDILLGISEVRRRHEHGGRSAAVHSWKYFEAAAIAWRERRVARALAGSVQTTGGEAGQRRSGVAR